MKPFRNILILLIVILVLGGGFFLVSQYDPESEDPAVTQGSDMMMYQMDKDDISRLTVANGDGVYTLKRENGKWIANDNPSIMISQSKADTLAYLCANISAKELIDENAADLAQYGLDTPRRSVTILKTDGTQTVVLIGNTASDGSVCYTMIQGETKVYTKNTVSCDNMTCSFSELFDTTLYSVAAEEIETITMARTGARTISLRKNPAEDIDGQTAYEWEMLEPLSKTANEFTISEKLLTSINSMTASRVIPIPEEGKDYGFSSPQASFSIKTSDGAKEYSVIVGKKEENKTYVMLKDRSVIYELPSDKLAFLELGYLEFVDKTIHLENIKDVTGVSLSGLGKEYTMTVSESEKAYAVNGKALSESAFKTVYQAMVGITMDDFTTDNRMGDVVFSVRYQKANGSESKVEYLSYDDRNYRVTVNGKGNLLIRKKQIDNLIALIDKTISE